MVQQPRREIGLLPAGAAVERTDTAGTARGGVAVRQQRGEAEHRVRVGSGGLDDMDLAVVRHPPQLGAGGVDQAVIRYQPELVEGAVCDPYRLGARPVLACQAGGGGGLAG
ncbi:hypothetical protein SANTM175S_08557 [Streptomyces antimycoticus]